MRARTGVGAYVKPVYSTCPLAPGGQKMAPNPFELKTRCL